MSLLNRYRRSLKRRRNIRWAGKDLTRPAQISVLQPAIRMTETFYELMDDPSHADIMRISPAGGAGQRDSDIQTKPSDKHGNRQNTRRQIDAHPFFLPAASPEDLDAAARAIALYTRHHFGFMTRPVDYKASFLALLEKNSRFFGPFAENARKIHRRLVHDLPYVCHAFVAPPPFGTTPGPEPLRLGLRIEERREDGIIVSGMKAIATAAMIAEEVFVRDHLEAGEDLEVLSFLVPLSTPGLRIVATAPTYVNWQFMDLHEVTDEPCEIESRCLSALPAYLEENDSLLVFSRVFIPEDRILSCGKMKFESYRDQMKGFVPRAQLHGLIRAIVKLDVLGGLVKQAGRYLTPGARKGLEEALADLLVTQNALEGLKMRMIEDAYPLPEGHVVPHPETAASSQIFMSETLQALLVQIEDLLAGVITALPIRPDDISLAELEQQWGAARADIDDLYHYHRVVSALRLMLAEGFGRRQLRFERNYLGSARRMRTLLLALASGSGALARQVEYADLMLSSTPN